MKTNSGEFVVYNKRNAGRPDLHKGGPWFFEPAAYDGGEVYSRGYPTKTKALAAAEAWETQQALEEEERRKPGRPSNDLSEQARLIRGPEALWTAAENRAKRDGVSLTEFVRRAIWARLEE